MNNISWHKFFILALYDRHMDNQDKIIALIYDISEEYIEKYHPSELDIIETVWEAMEVKNINDLKEIYESGNYESDELDDLSFESTSSTLISELVVAIIAHIIYGMFIEDKQEKIREKLNAKGFEKKIINQVYQYIYNIKKINSKELK